MTAQTHPLDTRRSTLSGCRRGFTLVELMVVITVIGLLAAFVSSASINAIRSAREVGVRAEIETLSMATETYKQKYGSYPPNLQDLPAVRQHILRLFPRCKDAIPTPTGTGAGTGSTSSLWNYIRGEDLPKVGSVILPAVWERTAAIQALPFWLGGFYADPEHPLSPPTDTAGNFIQNAPRVPLFDFKPGRLRLTGVAYRPNFVSGTPAGAKVIPLAAYYPEGLDTPYVYFNSSSYDPRDLEPLNAYSYPALNADGSFLLTSSKLTPVHLRYFRLRSADLKVGSAASDDLPALTDTLSWAKAPPDATNSVALPYRTPPANSSLAPNNDSNSTSYNPQSYVNPNSFQIICAGLDNMYSGILTQPDPLSKDGNPDTARGNLYGSSPPPASPTIGIYQSRGGIWWYPTGPAPLAAAISDKKLMRGPSEYKDNVTNFARRRLDMEIP